METLVTSRPPLYLTPEELVELTGRKLSSLQIKWLATKGWKYEVNATGRPIVARSYFEYRLGAATNPGERRFRPNLASVTSTT